MRKLILLIVIVTMLTVTYPSLELSDTGYDNSHYIYYYLESEIIMENTEIITNGVYYEMKVHMNYASSVKSKIKQDIVGESILIYGDCNTAYDYLNSIDARIIKVQVVDQITFIYAYTRKIRKSVETYGSKVNVQLAVRNSGEIVIGIPLILGSC